MSRIDDLVVFAHVAEQGSFSRAAENLGMTKSVVSKQVARLEQQLAARLFNRTTRRLNITDTGLQILPYAQRIMTELAGIDDAVSGLQHQVSGTLRVSAPVALGNKYLTAIASTFLKQYPHVKLVLTLTERQVDIVNEGFDLSIQLATHPPQSWHSRQLKTVRYFLCATPEYWQQHEIPKSPADLQKHCCLLNQESGNIRWRLPLGNGLWHEQRVSGYLVINTLEGLRTAVMQHAGIALLPDYMIEDDCVAGCLQKVMTNYELESPAGDSLYALYLPNRYLAPKAQAFINFLANALADNSCDKSISKINQHLPDPY